MIVIVDGDRCLHSNLIMSESDSVVPDYHIKMARELSHFPKATIPRTAIADLPKR